MWKLCNFHFDLPQFYADIFSLPEIYCLCMRPCDKVTEWKRERKRLSEGSAKLVMYKMIFTHLNLILSNSIMSWHVLYLLHEPDILHSGWKAHTQNEKWRAFWERFGCHNQHLFIYLIAAIGSSYHKSYIYKTHTSK